MEIMNILANITSQGQLNNFVAEQKDMLNKVVVYKNTMDSMYFNPSSPLADAQVISDNYKLMKKRTPMVIEYYKRKPTGPDDKDAVESIEMYINPERLIISNQKIKGKAYTRGGIFYHQWGDEHPSMQISGTTGLSQMRGIEQLEKIYYNSGALLRYQNVGIQQTGTVDIEKFKTNINNTTDILNGVMNGDINNILDVLKTQKNKTSLTSKTSVYDLMNYVVNSLSNTMSQAKIQSKFAELQNDLNIYYQKQSKITKNNNSLREELYNYMRNKIRNEKENPIVNLDDQIKILLAYELVDIFLNGQSQSNNFGINKLLINNTQQTMTTEEMVNIRSQLIGQNQANQLGKYVSIINELNQGSILDAQLAYEGWSDIADEATDEWRPRLIFIYFEDRIYIGMFDAFDYTRVAESPLINYNMRFTIIRQIIVTSNSKKTGPLTTTSTFTNNRRPNVSTASYSSNIEDMSIYKNNINLGKIRILELKDQLALNVGYKNINYTPTFLTSEQETNISTLIENIRSTLRSANVSVSDSDVLYGNATLTWQQRLDYFALAKYSVITEGKKFTNLYYGLSPDQIQTSRNNAIIEVKREIQRAQDVYNKEASKGTVSSERKQQIYNWIVAVREASGVTDNKWEKILVG